MAIEQNGKTFTLKGLAPGAKYVIEVQAIPKKGKPSEWSRPIKFNTASKDVAPPPVTDLQASFDGMGFVASWNGSSAKAQPDFAYFKVTITSSVFPLITKIYSIQSESFSLDYESILFAFLGIANSITIEVKSVDRSGNLSTGVSVTAGNDPPGTPTNVVVVAETMGYQVSWDTPPETDYSYSKIYESSTVDGTYNAIENVTATPSSIKVVGYATRYVKVSHVDTFGGESSLAPSTGLSVTPINPVTVDTTPPDQRTSISYTAGVEQITVSWANPTDTVNNSDLAGITIRYAKISSPTNYTWIDIPFTFISPLTSVVINELLPFTAYNVSISTYDKTQNRTEYSTPTQVLTLADTTPPPRPVVPVIAAGSSAGGPMMVRVTQNAIEHGTTTPLPQDTYYFRVFMMNAGQTTAPLPGITTNTNATEIGLIFAAFNGGTSQERFYVTLSLGEQRYFYTRAVDTSGNTGNASLAAQSSAMTIFDNAHIKDLSADKITTGTLTAGQWIDVGPTSSTRIRIENVSGGVGKIFSGTGVYSAANTGFYFDSDGKFSLKDRLSWNPSGIDPITGSTTGLLTIKGSIEAQSGSFTGNVQLNGGSLYALGSGGRISPSPPQKAVIFNSSGITAYNASGDPTFTLDANTGNISVDGYIAVGGAAGDVNTGGTNISGNKIKTGVIASALWNDVIPTTFTTDGSTVINLSGNSIHSPKFYVTAGNAGFLGQVTSTGLIIQAGSGIVAIPNFGPVTYSVLSETGNDILLKAVSGSNDPAKIRWLDSNDNQRATIGWEVNNNIDDTAYPDYFVIRGVGLSNVDGNNGKVLIDAGKKGNINLRALSVTINGQAVETTQGVINRYRNLTNTGQGKPNNITYSAGGNPATVSGTTINGDLHFKY